MVAGAAAREASLSMAERLSPLDASFLHVESPSAHMHVAWKARFAADPEFRSAFVAYVEWGTRLAVANSQPDADPAPVAPVPRWGWGEAPPYVP